MEETLKNTAPFCVKKHLKFWSLNQKHPYYIQGVAGKLENFAHPTPMVITREVEETETQIVNKYYTVYALCSRKGHAIDVPCSLVVALGRRARASDPPPDLYRLPLPCYIFLALK